MMLTIGSLFAGIGGLELGLERAGLGPVQWQVETDSFCRAVLAKRWPRANRSVRDVRRATAQNLRPVDLICGGFPCTDVSSAGLRKGLGGEASGLWFEFLRVVRAMRPPFVVVENVASGARKWLGPVLCALRGNGYYAHPVAISAASVGAPHERKRVFVVAYRQRDELRVQSWGRGGQGRQGATVACDGSEVLGNAVSAGRARPIEETRPEAWAESAEPTRGNDAHGVEPSLDCAIDGLPGWLAGSWPAGREAGQEAWEEPRLAKRVRLRAVKLRALGNAVVPACGHVVGILVRELALGEQKTSAAERWPLTWPCL